MEHMKKVFCIYRTKDFTEADKIERNCQKELCQQFTDEKKWLLVCEFWQTENNIIDAPPSGDLFPLLCWAAKHKLFDILLVSEFDRVGMFPMECSPWNVPQRQRSLSNTVLKYGVLITATLVSGFEYHSTFS